MNSSFNAHASALQRMREIIIGDLYIQSFLSAAEKKQDPNLPAIKSRYDDYVDACIDAQIALTRIENARAAFMRALEETPKTPALNHTEEPAEEEPLWCRYDDEDADPSAIVELPPTKEEDDTAVADSPRWFGHNGGGRYA